MKIYLSLLLFFVLNACTPDAKTIKIKGSDTEVNLVVSLAEAFHLENKEALISISGGGSGMGIASLLNGTADMANSSREINHEELALFHEKGVELDSFIFAQDAVAFVVSDKNDLDSVSTVQLAKLLSGEQKHWEKLNKQITIYGRQSNSGTYDYVKEMLSIDFSAYAKQMNGNAQILEAIKNDVSGIGYVGSGYLIHGNNQGLKVLKIYTKDKPAVSPLNADKIASGEYIFQRPLFQYFRVTDKEKIAPFLKFEQEAAGKNIIAKSGYYPINNI